MRTWGLALVVATVALANEPADFSRYQIIIDRSPFGAVTAAGVPDALPNFAQRFQLVGLVTANGSPGKVLAILLDRDANRSWFKTEGEWIKADSDPNDTGVKVVQIQDAQTTKPKVIIQFGLERATLSFSERPAGPAVAPVPGQPQPAPGAMPARPPFAGRIPFRRSN